MTDVVSFDKILPEMEKATNRTIEQAKAGYQEFQTKVQTMMDKQMQSVAEAQEFAKGNFEAVVQSARAVTSGAETLATHFVESSKAAVEEAQAAFKALASAKTPAELFQQQNDFAKAQFDKFVTNLSKTSETWMKVAGEVIQPLSNRAAIAAETVKKTVA